MFCFVNQSSLAKSLAKSRPADKLKYLSAADDAERLKYEDGWHAGDTERQRGE
jgi:hypothetical protein